MVRRVSEYIVGWQIKKSILTGDQRAVYLYAYEVLINYIMNMIVAFLIAIIMHSTLTVFIYLASYLLLRSYSGGYHAESNGGCTIVSAFLVFVVCLLKKVITGDFVFALLFISLVISGGLIFRFAPIPAKNKPLDEEETVRYRIRSRQIWILEAIIGIFFLLINPNVSAVIAISHMLFSLTLMYGMLIKYKNEA